MSETSDWIAVAVLMSRGDGTPEVAAMSLRPELYDAFLLAHEAGFLAPSEIRNAYVATDFGLAAVGWTNPPPFDYGPNWLDDADGPGAECRRGV